MSRDFRIINIALTRYEWEVLTKRLRDINAEDPGRQIQAGRMFWLVVSAIEASCQSKERNAMTILKAAKEILLVAETMEQEHATIGALQDKTHELLEKKRIEIIEREATVARRESATAQVSLQLSTSRATVKARDEELKKMQEKIDKAREEKGAATIALTNARHEVLKLQGQIKLLIAVNTEAAAPAPVEAANADPK